MFLTGGCFHWLIISLLEFDWLTDITDSVQCVLFLRRDHNQVFLLSLIIYAQRSQISADLYRIKRYDIQFFVQFTILSMFPILNCKIFLSQYSNLLIIHHTHIDVMEFVLSSNNVKV